MKSNEVVDVWLNHKHQYWISDEVDDSYILKCVCGDINWIKKKDIKDYDILTFEED